MLEDEDYRDKEQQAAVKCVGTNQKFQTGERERMNQSMYVLNG